MNLMNHGALAGALLVAAGLAPTGATAQDQSRDTRDSVMRAVQIGRGSRLGVSVQDVEDSSNKQVKSGVIVETVEPGGPADKAGMKAGDAITEFDGEHVRSVRQFQRLVQESALGRSVPVVLSRDGQRVSVNVTPVALGSNDDFAFRYLDVPSRVRPAVPAPPTPPATPRAPLPPSFDLWRSDGPLTIIAGRGRLGVTSEELTPQLAQYFGVKDGALVKSVQEGSAAEKAGIKAGDVITGVNGSHVYDPSDISRAVNRLESGAEFSVDIVREHKTQTLKGKLETPARRSGTRM